MDKSAVYGRINAHKDKGALALPDFLIGLTCERSLADTGTTCTLLTERLSKSFWTSNQCFSLWAAVHTSAFTDFLGFFLFKRTVTFKGALCKGSVGMNWNKIQLSYLFFIHE